MPEKDEDGLYPHQREIVDRLKSEGKTVIVVGSGTCTMNTVKEFIATHTYELGIIDERPVPKHFDFSKPVREDRPFYRQKENKKWNKR